MTDTLCVMPSLWVCAILCGCRTVWEHMLVCINWQTKEMQNDKCFKFNFLFFSSCKWIKIQMYQTSHITVREYVFSWGQMAMFFYSVSVFLPPAVKVLLSGNWPYLLFFFAFKYALLMSLADITKLNKNMLLEMHKPVFLQFCKRMLCLCCMHFTGETR